MSGSTLHASAHPSSRQPGTPAPARDDEPLPAQPQATNPRHGRLLRAAPTGESHRATPLELFFDVVYVFAFTQVTHLMASQGNLVGVLQGAAVFGLLWWSWASYAWLANQVHAQRGIGAVAILSAIALVFVLSLAIPGAFHAHPGPAAASLVFAVGYVGVCVAYTAVTLIAAAGHPRLRGQVLRTMGATLLLVTPALVTGALLGGRLQILLWLAAVAVQGTAVWLTSRDGEWRLPSAAHYGERHQLVVILALGESVVSIGTGAAGHPLSPATVTGAVLSITLALAIWWNYFHHLADSAQRALSELTGTRRAKAATTGTYLHLGIVGGILLTALGLGTAMHHASSTHALGLFGAAALGGGLTLNHAALTLYGSRVAGRTAARQLFIAPISALLIPALAALPPLASIALATTLCLTTAGANILSTPARQLLEAGDAL
ncbi:low temperature requirement protein LtrA [Streptacidiphilus sp. MAP12-16]|uniref:low temperature requirement protein A n=1 Tax=Streptacidiphilus sp. MAP12-16 TaxID=3156300 RepID=UPI0035122DED